MLAGLAAGPEVYSPRKRPRNARSRGARSCSQQMHEKGFLNDAQYEAAKDEPVRLAPRVDAPSSELAPEAVEIAKKMLHELEPASARRAAASRSRRRSIRASRRPRARRCATTSTRTTSGTARSAPLQAAAAGRPSTRRAAR